MGLGLFFLDYIATAHIEPQIADIVKGMADGCCQVGCALIGGETAECGFYAEGSTISRLCGGNGRQRQHNKRQVNIGR